MRLKVASEPVPKTSPRAGTNNGFTTSTVSTDPVSTSDPNTTATISISSAAAIAQASGRHRGDGGRPSGKRSGSSSSTGMMPITHPTLLTYASATTPGPSVVP